MTIKITGFQYKKLTDALLDAFPTQTKLAQMVRYRLNKNLSAIALGDSLQDIVFRLIEVAVAEGWLINLVFAARESNPGNPMLLEFGDHLKLTPILPAGLQPETIIRKTNSFLDVTVWRKRLGYLEPRVCRVEVQSNLGTNYGTGFLIASNLLLTAYHVVAPVIEDEQDLSSNHVLLRFDFKRLADGTTINPGTIYYLPSSDWLVDFSPRASGEEPSTPGQLDYALLRVDGNPGYDPVGANAEPDASQRGWIKLPAESYNFRPNTPLCIIQHPKGDPLKLAVDTEGVIGVNAIGTMVQYRTNTLPGSSGSPCFDSNWNLVAMHHTGDPDYYNPMYNAGTPVSAIRACLEAAGLKNLLDASMDSET